MNNIALNRQKRGLTQNDLAKALGWNPSRIGNYEAGIRKPSLDDSRSIVSALNKLGCKCSLDDVFPPKQFN